MLELLTFPVLWQSSFNVASISEGSSLSGIRDEVFTTSQGNHAGINAGGLGRAWLSQRE
jgi:hypothetical protein